MRPYYDDGTCTIYHGDCREVLSDDLYPLSEMQDTLITDPPYGISHASRGGPRNQRPIATWLGEQIKGDDSTALRDEVLAWWGDRPAAVFGSWRIPRPTATRAVLIWEKGGAAGMGDLSLPWKPSHEEIYILGYGWHGRRDVGVLMGHHVQAHASLGRVHPHEKPVGLLRHLISKTPAGVIFDPFMGSGTTLRAAKDLGRKAIGIEIEERYCEIAAKRLGQEVLAL